MANKHISFPEYEATATVAEDCPQHVIDALKKMCRIAYYNLKQSDDKFFCESEHLAGEEFRCKEPCYKCIHMC